jgi:hypothetical protein
MFGSKDVGSDQDISKDDQDRFVGFQLIGGFKHKSMLKIE